MGRKMLLYLMPIKLRHGAKPKVAYKTSRCTDTVDKDLRSIAMFPLRAAAMDVI
jgi:hypothetical protein